LDSLTRDIEKNLLPGYLDLPENLSKDYLLFFEILLNKKRGIKNITLLNAGKDTITTSVTESIQKTSDKWLNLSNIYQKVIAPITNKITIAANNPVAGNYNAYFIAAVCSTYSTDSLYIIDTFGEG